MLNEIWTILKPMLEEKLKDIAKILGTDPDINEVFFQDKCMLVMKFGIGVRETFIRASVMEKIDSEGNTSGMTIEIEAIKQGHILTDHIPYNYTGDFWTVDVEELKRRIDDFSPTDFAYRDLAFYFYRPF